MKKDAKKRKKKVEIERKRKDSGDKQKKNHGKIFNKLNERNKECP